MQYEIELMRETFKGFGENNILQLLILNLYQRSLVVPRFTPAGWFESDLFEVLPSGYCREYEVKTSRKDFEKDRFKQRRGYERGFYYGIKKHEALEARAGKTPNYFNFVVPDGLVALEDIPEWSGLIVVRLVDRGLSATVSLAASVLKKAPRLHDQKTPETWREGARTSAYFRFVRGFIGR